MISAKIKIMIVNTAVTTAMPLFPHKRMAKDVAKAVIATFTRLFPSKIVPINLSGSLSTRFTILVLFGFVSARCLKRSLLTAMRAVSDPEKKAEKNKSNNKENSRINMFISFTTNL